MIKINKLNKYYNLGKNNEIHVINNTSIELPSTGLISFIGSSGSGKTTLLNTIGGLDKANSGSISYDDIKFNKYHMNQIDKYRKCNIGYIFQNYLLLENESIYNNLKIALDIIGVTDPVEQNKRISYTLKAVGLYKYRKKLAGTLSGGQMQRVSIARALVKNNKTIIADEPTGNLDSDNSIEIMNILKKISKKTLVLLVTHNKELAEFYSDKIINLKDGQIVSVNENINSDSIEHESNSKIYLLDYNKEEIHSDNCNISIYSKNDSINNNLRNDINIIFKNDTIYIESKKKIQIVDNNNIKLYNAHYEKLSLKKIDEFDYDISFYNDSKKKKKLKAVFDEIKSLILDFFNVNKKSKIFHRIFFLIGFFIGLMVISDSNYNINSSPDETNEPNSSYLTKYYDSSNMWAKTNEIPSSLLLEAIDNDYVYGIVKRKNIPSILYYSKNSVNNVSVLANAYAYDYTNQAILVGRKPYNNREIVLGKKIADKMLSQIDKRLTYSNLLGMDYNNNKIVGISSLDTNSYYFINNKYEYNFSSIVYNKALLSGLGDANIILSDKLSDDFVIGQKIYYENYTLTVSSFSDLGLAFGASTLALNKKLYYDYENSKIVELKDKENILDCLYINSNSINYTSLEGKLPSLETECAVNYNTGYKINDIVNGLIVTGLYKCDDESVLYDEINIKNVVIKADKYFLKKMVKDELSSSYYEYVYLINDSKEAKQFFNEKDYSYENCYSYTSTVNKINTKSDRYEIFVIEIVLLCVCVVYTYFSTRSKMIFDIYEIGVLRSLGASKQKIYNKYIKENFIKITFTSVIGYLITVTVYSIVASKLNSIISGFVGEIGFLRGFLYLVIMYFVQILIGLIPVFILLRKTPAEINSKYDI